MKRIRRIIRPMLCMVVLLFAMTTGVMGCYQKDPDPIEVPSGTSEVEATPIPAVNRQAELADAKSRNPDAVAWLYIPGAEVDDPVMQAEDNGFYLNRDELREYSTWGCYYADCRNHLSGRDALDTNTVIYGHSSNDCDPDGVRFTKLHRYMDADFVKENPYIYLSVDGDDLIFQITALFITDTGFDYIDPNPMGSKLAEFFQTVEKKNWLDIAGVTFSEGDTFLTLSTCCRRGPRNRRSPSSW